MKRRVLSSAAYALTTVIGSVAFLYPFLLPSLVGLALVALLLEVQGQELILAGLRAAPGAESK